MLHKLYSRYVSYCNEHKTISQAGKRPNQKDAHDAILAAVAHALQLGCPPAIILLQEYSWKTNGNPGLKSLIQQLNTGSSNWAARRQWEDIGKLDTGSPGRIM